MNGKRILYITIFGLILLGVSFDICLNPQSRFDASVIWQGPQDKPVIALTFDDGPDPIWTPKVLKVLENYNIQATFFVVGSKAEAYPDIVREIVDKGHLVGNHTYSHRDLLLEHEFSVIQTELLKTNKIIEDTCGITPRYFRPPHGKRNPLVEKVITDAQMEMVLWTTMPKDWRKPGVDKIVQMALNKIENGTIITLHDGQGNTLSDNVDRSQTVTALPEIIEEIKGKGYTFVTIEGLLKNSP